MNATQLFEGVVEEIAIPNREILSVTENTARANFDSVFVCIKGARADGHTLAMRAYENGCRLFVAEHPLSLPTDALVLTVENTRKTLARLACNLYAHPSRKMHLIGITGTKGKTTTAQLLSHILNQNGISCGYIGTNGVKYGSVKKELANTTPDALTLQKTLSEMLCNGIKTAVIEVSSQALMQYRVEGTHFTTALFTNLYTDHIGPFEHADFAEYLACKHRLFTDFDLENVIVNSDDAHTKQMLEGCQASNRITCSILGSADCSATKIVQTQTDGCLGVSFLLNDAGTATPIELPLLGACNASNALLAAAVATRIFKISAADTARALRSVAIAGRCECIPLPSGGVAVIDYAHNGESMRQILSSLRPYVKGRLICLFGSVGERSQLRRKELGRAARDLADLTVLTSDNPGREDPERIIDEIAAEWQGHEQSFLRNADRKEAILQALKETHNGDVLLLAGKGHEQYQLIGTEKLPFSEREIVTSFCKSAAMIG